MTSRMLVNKVSISAGARERAGWHADRRKGARWVVSVGTEKHCRMVKDKHATVCFNGEARTCPQDLKKIL